MNKVKPITLEELVSLLESNDRAEPDREWNKTVYEGFGEGDIVIYHGKFYCKKGISIERFREKHEPYILEE